MKRAAIMRCGFVAALLLATVADAQSNPVIFQSTDTPPFWSPSLPDHGLGGRMLQLVSEAAGVPYTIDFLPVKRFRNSQSVYMVGDPDILTSRIHRAIFPIGIFRSAFFYYKPHHAVIEFRSLRALRGYTLGVLRGTLEDKDYFVRNGIYVEESDSAESLLRKLKKGRIDFCILVSSAGRYTIEQLFPDGRDDFIQVSIPGSQRPIAIIIDVATPGARAVAQRYRHVLKQTLNSPAYQQILGNHYGHDNVPADTHKLLSGFVDMYEDTWKD